jgi:hypothetical protein
MQRLASNELLRDTPTIDSGVSVQAEYGLVLDYDDTVHNSGIISGSESGVYFVISGVLVNASTGQISGGVDGVDLDFSSGTIENSGTISGGYAGIVNRGGSVVNAAGAVIEGGTIGVNAGSGAAIALTNSGTIEGGSRSLGISQGGSVVNDGTLIGAVVASNFGVTLTNAGTISGSILFDDTTSDNRLVLAPGSQITGSISVGGTGNVLELEAGAGSGTFNDFAGNASGFGSVVLDSGADWVLSGASPSGVTRLRSKATPTCSAWPRPGPLPTGSPASSIQMNLTFAGLLTIRTRPRCSTAGSCPSRATA